MEDHFLTILYQIIENNIANENFSVEELAKEAGLSRSMLHRKLKKLTGKSASDHITEIRLNHAKTLLENNVATVSEIAYRVGFNDPSYFNKVFKKHFNISPGNVRTNLADIQIHPSTDHKPEIQSSAKLKGYRLFAKAALIILIIIIAGGGVYYLFSGKRPSVKSVAVLPLHNLTGQPDNDYFVDGMHDALIGELGQMRSLRVISRTSTLRYRNSDMLLPDIANELGVNTIVEGSVSGAGDSLRVLIQLIDVFPKERHLWSNEYYDDMHNVLKIQTTAANDIAQKIRIKLTKDEEQLLAKSYTVDPETYKAYLRGMYYINQGTEESIKTGEDHLVKAIERDPGDPFAYAGFALGKAIQGHGMVATRESFRSAAAAAEKALRIDRTNNEAHTALALLYLYQYWDWLKAQEAFEITISINPNNAIAHAHYAWYYVLLGDMRKSIYHAKMAVEIDPLSASWQTNLAWLYYHNGEYDQAEFWAKKSLELSDNVPSGNLVLGWTYLKNEQFREAIETHEKLPDSPRWKFFRCRTYALTGEKEKALSLWNELEKSSEEYWVNPFYLGMVAGILGFTDKAFELLNEAYYNNYFPITYIEVFPSAEFIRNDPRYKTLLQKMNLPVNFSSTLAATQQ
ncbi:helix-turn-helix domain-containing protein [Bacteroidota bacterium]